MSRRNTEKHSAVWKTVPIPKRRKTLGRSSELPSSQYVKSDVPAITARCWECYKSNADLICIKCEKGFHKRCVTIKSNDCNWMCTRCKSSKILEPTIDSSESQKINEQLQMVASSIELDKCIGSDLTPILQKMSLTKNDEEHLKDVLKRKCESIKENLKKNYYKSGEQFAEDIKTMLFEFFQALDSRHESHAKLHNWAKALLQTCKEKLRILDLCEFCFVNSIEKDEWFTTVCSKRHEVVWAAYKSYPPWPAKVLQKDEVCVTVQFFGERTIGRVKHDKVNPYSSRNSNEISKSKKIKKCLPEVDLYIRNLMADNFNIEMDSERSDDLIPAASHPDDLIPAASHPLNLLLNEFHGHFSNELQLHLSQSEELKKENNILDEKLSSMRRAYAKLEEANMKLTTETERLCAESLHFKNECANLSQKVKEIKDFESSQREMMKKKNDDLENEVMEKKNEINELKLKITSLEAKLHQESAENSDKDSRIEILLKDLESCKSQQQVWREKLELFMEMGKVLGTSLSTT